MRDIARSAHTAGYIDHQHNLALMGLQAGGFVADILERNLIHGFFRDCG